MGVRPEALGLTAATESRVLLRGHITMVERLGAISYAYVTAKPAAADSAATDGAGALLTLSPICVELRGDMAQRAQVGDEVGIAVEQGGAALHWFDATGVRITDQSAAE
jgi:hypothetical protein